MFSGFLSAPFANVVMLRPRIFFPAKDYSLVIVFSYYWPKIRSSRNTVLPVLSNGTYLPEVTTSVPEWYVRGDGEGKRRILIGQSCFIFVKKFILRSRVLH
jgi:hypothetical protein